MRSNGEVRKCVFCRKEIVSFNRHRNSCYECKAKYPYVPAPPAGQGGGEPFNRRLLIDGKQGK